MSIELVMPFSHLILLSPSPPFPNPPSIRVFSNESTLSMRWPKYWSFIFSISPSKEHPGPISFRMDWLDVLAVQGTLNTLLPHHSSKASILSHSPSPTESKRLFSTSVPLLLSCIQGYRYHFSKFHIYVCLCFLICCLAFLPRSKRLLISWLQSLSAVILEPRKIVSHCFHCFPIYLP